MTIKHRGTRGINDACATDLDLSKRRRGLLAGLRYIRETSPPAISPIEVLKKSENEL
jgi:hypothetical protein